MASIFFEYEGKKYTYRDGRWLDSDHLGPSASVLEILDDSMPDALNALLNAAKAARDADQNPRALDLATRAMRIDPRHQGAAAVASSVYRKLGRPKDAMRLADEHRKTGTNYIPLLTSRAAALLDLDSLSKARKQVDEIHALMESDCREQLEERDFEFISNVEARLRWAEEQELKELEDAREPESFTSKYY